MQFAASMRWSVGLWGLIRTCVETVVFVTVFLLLVTMIFIQSSDLVLPVLSLSSCELLKLRKELRPKGMCVIPSIYSSAPAWLDMDPFLQASTVPHPVRLSSPDLFSLAGIPRSILSYVFL